jgi:putative transposase
VFFNDADRKAYPGWLEDYASRYRAEILACCLMSNHIHLVAEPASAEGLQRMLRPLHMRYAQRINRARGWRGHLWQGRFCSSALDEEYLWAAVRYVERNPMRAKLVRRAEYYRWSSAAAHCGLRTDAGWTKKVRWRRQFEGIGDWSGRLGEGEEAQALEPLRRHAEKGLPGGFGKFIRKLEQAPGLGSLPLVVAGEPLGRP